MDASDNEAGFIIERSANGIDFAPVATVGADRTTYVDTGLTPGARYWYRACSFNGNGVSPPTAAVSGAATEVANTAPAVSGLVDHLIDRSSSTTIRLSLADAESEGTALQVWAESSNPGLVPVSNIVISGVGADRTVTITPAGDLLGAAKIILGVNDGTFTTRTSFVLTVFSNTPPAISNFSDRSIVQGSSTGRISFAVEDADTPAEKLSLQATSSNPALVPPQNIVFGGSGTRRTVAITPAPHATGVARIGIRVGDSGLSTLRNFDLTVTAPTQGRLLNLSSRVRTQSDNTPIVGLVIQGSPKRVLLRSVGPTLAAHPFNLPAALPNPRLRLLQQQPTGYVEIASNHDWGRAANASVVATTTSQVYAFDLGNQSRDAALVLEVPAGQYTLLADDEEKGTGVALVETYDADGEVCGGQLINLSARGYAGVGDDVLITGFVVATDGPQTVLVRAVGPTLAAAPFHVPGALTDPVIALYRKNDDGSDRLVVTQDDWGAAPDSGYTAAIATRVSAFPLQPGSKDAAFVLTLAPGLYTAVVHGKDGGCGTVLAEIYAVR